MLPFLSPVLAGEQSVGLFRLAGDGADRVQLRDALEHGRQVRQPIGAARLVLVLEKSPCGSCCSLHRPSRDVLFLSCKGGARDSI